ncbi:MAG: hypothetical protein EOP11_09925 [Proteobacteria bacterium]|nr:MAG: hypothetical protein EOP11_09925 [Pseudomonadota bacterium]
MINASRLSLTLFFAASLITSGCGNTSAGGDAGIAGVGDFKMSIANGAATLSVVLETLAIDAGARVPISKPAGAFIEMGPDFQSGGTLLVLSVPLSSLMKDYSGLPLVGLPDGRALPGVREGALGAVAFELPAIGLTYFYLSGDAYGIFFPVSLPKVPVMVSSKIKDEKGNLLGVIWGVPKSGKNQLSGVLFLFPVDGGA